MKRIAAGFMAVLGLCAMLYWAHDALKRRELVEAVVALVDHTTAELGEALSLEAASSLAGIPLAVSRLERYARSTTDRLAELKKLDTRRDPELAEAAQAYMEAARQLLENQVASHRHRSQFDYSTEVLRDHMATAGRRADGWIEEALRRKRQVDRDFVQYRHAAEDYGRLLQAYPDASAGLAARLGQHRLVEASLASEARERVIEAGRRAAAQMDKARQLAAPR